MENLETFFADARFDTLMGLNFADFDQIREIKSREKSA